MSKTNIKNILASSTALTTVGIAALFIGSLVTLSPASAGQLTISNFDGSGSYIQDSNPPNGYKIYSGFDIRLVSVDNSGTLGDVDVVAYDSSAYLEINEDVEGDIDVDALGVIEIINTGTVTNIDPAEKLINAKSNGGDITITNSGHLVRIGGDFASHGIHTSTNLSGETIINNTGNITMGNGIGIDAFHYDGDGDVTINHAGNISFSGPPNVPNKAINIVNNDGGETFINASGAVTGGLYGIYAEHQANAGDLHITSDMTIGELTAPISHTGIYTVVEGSTTNITQNANIFSLVHAIDANSTTGTININANGVLNGYTDVVKFNSTSGDVNLTVNGDINGDLTGLASAILGSTSGTVTITNKNIITGAVNVTGADATSSEFINEGTWNTGLLSIGSSFTGALSNSGIVNLNSNLAFDTLNMSGGTILFSTDLGQKLTVKNVNQSGGNISAGTTVANFIGKTGGTGTVTQAAGGGASVTALGGQISTISQASIDVTNMAAGNIDVSNTGAQGVINNASGAGITTTAQTGITNINVDADVTGSTDGIRFNTASGNVNINIGAGSTVAGGNNAIAGTGTGTVAIDNDGTLDGNVNITNINEATSTFSNDGTWNVAASGSSFLGALQNAGNINLAGDLTINRMVNTGTIAGAGGIRKVGNGVWTIDAASSYTYAGDTQLENGTIAIDGNKTLGTGNFRMADGTIVRGDNVSTLNNDILLADGGTQTFDAAGTSFSLTGNIGGTGTARLTGNDIIIAASSGSTTANFDIFNADLSNYAANLGNIVSLASAGSLSILANAISQTLNLAGGVDVAGGTTYSVANINQTGGTVSGAGTLEGNFIAKTGGTGTIAQAATGGAISTALGGTINANSQTGIEIANTGAGDVAVANSGAQGVINNASGDGIKTTTETGATSINVAANVTGSEDGLDFTSTNGDVVIDIASATVTGVANAINGTTGGDVTLNNAGTLTGLVNITSNASGSNFSNTGIWNAAGGASSFSGDFANYGTLNMQNSSVADSLQTANLTLGNASSLKMDIDDIGNADTISVAGTVALDGTLDILASNSSNIDYKSQYMLIDNDGTADAVTGSFNSITSNLAFLEPVANTAGGDGNDVMLNFALPTGGLDFKQFAQDQNQKNAAISMDSFDYNSTDGQTVYDQLVGLTNSQARNAIEQITGEDHLAASRFGGHIAAQYRERVLDHTTSKDQQTEPSQALGYTITATSDANIIMWAESFATLAKINKGANIADLSSFDAGVVIGADYKINDDWTIGASAGYTESKFDTITQNTVSTSDNFHIGGYGSWGAVAANQTGLGISGVVDYTHHAHKTHRALAIGGLNRTAIANYNGSTIGGEVKLRYGIDVSSDDANKLVIAPFIGMAASHTRNNGFTETGAGVFNITSGASVSNQLSTLLGVQISSQTKINNTDVNFHASAAWKHEFGDVRQTSKQKLQGSSKAYMVSTPREARNSVKVKAGVDIKTAENITISFAAFGEFSRTSQNYGIQAGFKIRF